ncbi:MAG: M23 family metallopeptidase [Proteobacteria bacterium]|nr:M23 family metallopeptidase [Pseudomonadota bacterium]
MRTKHATSLSNKGANLGRRGRYFCIWIVSPFEGQVRKVKLKLWSGPLLGAFALVGLVAFGCLVGDYARIQLLRAQNSLFVRSLSVERDRLKDTNKTLKSKLNVLEGEQERSGDFEREMRERLDALRSVVSSIESLGSPGANESHDIMGSPKLSAQRESTKGVGGAEIDCSPGDIKCSGVVLDEVETESVPAEEHASQAGAMDRLGSAVKSQLLKFAGMLFLPRQTPQEELLDEMDRHIKTIRLLPLAPPGDAEITSEFGYRKSPFSGRKALHEGMDFSLQPGSPALATGDGIVKDVRYHPTYGLVIDIEHTPRVTTRYAHLRKSLVKRGEKVARGSTIGLVGSTGRSTGPHLHYEVRIDGKPRNPEDLIALGQRLSDIL